MSINTPIGDNLDTFLENLLNGQSAITHWKSIETSRIYGKVGGDLGDYDVAAKVASYKGRIPEPVFLSLSRLSSRFPTLMSISMLIAIDAFLDAGYIDQIAANDNIATIVAGHNLNQHQHYTFNNHADFDEEPDFIDGLFALKGLDTNHVGIISEVLQLKGPGYTVGGACASGNMALRAAVDEIMQHGVSVAAVVGPVLNFSPLDIHGMALLGAITYQSFNDTPAKASRPYDTDREGFVPSHGAAALILEDLDHALRRGARIYAEVLGVESSTDGSHLPQPSREGQTRLMKRLLKTCNVKPEEVDYISAHATSTPLGDLTEIQSIKDVFGDHAYQLKINAPKSMLGHACWSAATVETVAAVLQMKRGELHPSINVDNLDPAIDLDICRNRRTVHPVNIMMKNSFGFGGLNSICLLKNFNN
jgi:3-oxoacyl-(acyl-carrier-protein) synthase